MGDHSQNEKEFRALYEAHYNSLCRASYRILNEKETAREVVQEVFTEIWRRQNWPEIKSIQAYLFTSVYNRSLKALNKRKRFVSDRDIPELAVTDSNLEQSELEIIITTGIDQLPERCKEVFILSREQEMTYKEIANHLGLSIKTVENQMGIALKKLRDYLKKHE